MSGNYIAQGNSLTWTNGTGSDVASGDVVTVGHMIGVASVDIANGASGTVEVEGVFEVPCNSADVIAVGDKLDWDASAGEFVDAIGSAASGDLENGVIAMTAAADTVVLVQVKLVPGAGSYTA
jgi:predicted RecA/RadA family phage recombinase